MTKRKPGANIGPEGRIKKQQAKEKGFVEKQQVMIRLWPSDYEKFKVKLAIDQITVTRAFEAWVKSYLRGNKALQSILVRDRKPTDAGKRRYSVDEYEAEAILRRLEEVSPLQDINILMDEAIDDTSDSD